ncbi:ABC transporter permease [Spiroplasma taiwanense]|uniref:ABC transporter permease n=1 Tax=Spiroplasma taiwanense CT-1 TaxID=1276220 RepID=S5M0P7_9MOLU|nr:ABC transporter permease [Spiroplasma taiwanense]AGR41582.1 ABC transporter permease [Spiroplasma taiwanense CT-1]
MRGIRLLLKNAFKTAWRSPSQLIGLSSLVMLVSMITSLLSSTSTRVIDAYEYLNTNSNVRNVVMDIDQTTTRLEKPDEFNLNIESQEVYQQWVLNKMAQNYKFNWSRTEARTFSDIKMANSSLVIKILAKTNQNDKKAVDKLVVSKGENFSAEKEKSKREIIVGESFALANKLSVGDIIRVQKDQYGDQLLVKSDKNIAEKMESWESFYDIENSEYSGMNWFKVIGFGSSSDFVTPIIDSTTVIPNVDTEAIMYIDPQLFGLSLYEQNYSNDNIYNFDNRNSVIVVSSDSDKETYYSLKFNSSNITEEQIENLNTDFKYYGKIKKEITFFFKSDDQNYRFHSRTLTFKSVINAYNIAATLLLIIILVISLFTIILITRKQIDNMKRQIGCLKSLGYKKREIVNNFIAAPLIVAIIGSILGYIISIFIGGTIVGVFSKYFNIAFTGFTFEVISLIVSIIAIWLILTITAIIMAYYTIKNSTLNLLKGNADRGISKFGLAIKRGFSRGNFNSKLRTALLTTSLGKLFGVSITMFLGTIMLTTTIVAPKVLKDNMTETFNGLNFKNQIEYTQPIASNPLSFYRTYNLNFENDDWGYNEEKYVQTYSGEKKVTGKTAAPVINNGTTTEIDVEKIINQIINGDINSQFYTYDIYGDQEEHNGGPEPWSVMSYLNWKNLSIDFLKNLDKVYMEDNIINNIGLATLLNQWIDYGLFKTEIQSVQTEKELANSLLWFYKKYTSGISLQFNPSFTQKEENWLDWKWDSGKTIDSMFKTEIVKKLWLNGNIEDLISEENQNFKPILNEKTKMAEIDFYGIDIKNISIEEIEDQNKVLELNQALIMWYTATFQNRLGAVILETAYSRAPYFVQQYIKTAYENNEKYNISFNLVPYDPNTEEIGTFFNINFQNRKKILESAKIYGINPDTNLLDLRSETGEKLNQNLYENNIEEDNLIPIIINETLATKSGYKVDDVINLEVIKDEVIQNDEVLNLDDNFSKNNQVAFEEYRSQSSRTYYSSSGKSFVDNPIFGDVNSIKYGNKSISGSNASSSTNTTQIHQSVLGGETYIFQNKDSSNKFKIVGIQKGYGKAQGWVLNQNANKIMSYDKIIKWYFENYFMKEWAKLPELKSAIGGDPTIIDNITDYDNFFEKLNSGENQEELNKINDLFNNLYPVFNYKNSPNQEFLDLTKGFSTSQRFGDYSSRGLNGTYSANKDDGTISEYVEGLGIGSLSTMMPLEKTRQILGQITEIVNMTMIMFMVIALIVSITIILLTTGLIIYENKEFIATMKILGYSNKYIVRQILGMYVLPIIFTFIIGFITGWFIFVWAIDLLALTTVWVLPVSFVWWIPVSVFLIILGVYTLSFLAGWANIQKINPLEALKIND